MICLNYEKLGSIKELQQIAQACLPSDHKAVDVILGVENLYTYKISFSADPIKGVYSPFRGLPFCIYFAPEQLPYMDIGGLPQNAFSILVEMGIIALQ